MNENPEGAATGEEIARAAESVVEPTVGPLVEPVAIRFERPKNAPVPTPEPEPEPRIETMEVVAEEPPKKKSKGGLIAMLVLLVAAFAAALVALIIVNPFKGEDKVPAAIAKLMSGATGDKIALEGIISATSNYDDNYLQSLAADFNFGSDAKTGENFVNANITATFADESEFEFEANEMHTKNGDLYLKLSGISDALNNYTPPTLNADNALQAENLYDIETTNCLPNEDGTLNCLILPTEDCDPMLDEDCIVYEPYYDPTASILESLGMFEALDDEWILIPDSNFSTVESIFDFDVLVDYLTEIAESAQDFAAKYSENPFVTYSTDGLKIAKKKNALYRLGVDDEKLAGFINSLENIDVTVRQIAEITKHVSDFYVEIDDNNNITRIYALIETDEANVTIDLAVIYPTSIDLEEPTLYLDFNELMRSMLEQFYGEPITKEEI